MYTIKNTIFILAVLSIFFGQAVSATVIPIRLACELRVSPEGIDVDQPAFSYVLQALDSERAIDQTAYQIQVSSRPDFRTGGDLWDTKKVTSDRMAYISYAGRQLYSNQKCWWRVRVWDNKNARSAWSAPATWTMGILKITDWKASWISAAGAEKFALPSLGYQSLKAGSENEIKWIQVDLGTSLPFSEVNLYPMFYADKAGFAFPRRFKLEAADNPAFTGASMLADYTSTDYKNPGFKIGHFYTKNARGRYVRLTVTRLAQWGQDYLCALRQIEVISSGKNIAAGRPVQTLDSDERDGFTKNNLTDRATDYSAIPNYSSMYLRKQFGSNPGLVRAVINISGLSAYELTINGNKIGNALFSPGWTDYRKTVLYDTYDVTPEMKSGENVIGVLLGNGMYNIQPDTLRYVKFLNTFGPAKAIAQLRLEYADGSVKIIGTDSTWKVSPGPITYSNLYGGEDFNANLQPKGWDRSNFQDADGWHSALETAGPGGSLKGLSCAAPPVTAIDTIQAVKIIRVRDNLFIYDFGQNASMMPALRVVGPKGAYVRMTPSELLDENGLADRRSATQDGVRPAWWQYTLAGQGTEKWFPKFFYQGARYLQVELFPSADGVLPHIENIADVIIHSSSKPIGSFQSSNLLFNKIYSLVRWAQRSNMMSFMTDCPHREKMGWLEENHLNGPSLRYNYDMSLLFRKTMNDMADAQLSNGLVPNIAPEYFIAGVSDLTNGFRNSPEWGSSFIIVPWQQYLFSGDISLLKQYYDRMKRYVGFLSAEAQNNIIYTGLGDWYDIGPKEPWGSQLTPVSFTATAIYYYDNWIMCHIAKQMGKTKDVIYFRQQYEQIRKAFNQKFYHPETGIYGTGSQTCNAMPLFFNLVAPQNRDRLMKALIDDIEKHDHSFTVGEVGYRFLLRALADEDRSNIVYEMNNQSEKPGYGYQIKKGATSLTEKWDAGVGNFGSQNHFMSGQINEWFFNDLVGIRPEQEGAGFRRFVVKPANLPGLNWVNGMYSSISGDIKCSWQRNEKQFQLDIVVPVNTTAVVYLPAEDKNSVKESGKFTGEVKGIQFINAGSGKCIYKLKSGHYHFTTH